MTTDTTQWHQWLPERVADVKTGKLSMATLVTLDGVIQDPGGFGEIEAGGWGNPYFTEDGQQDAYEHLMASDYFLCGRVTYELPWTSTGSGCTPS